MTVARIKIPSLTVDDQSTPRHANEGVPDEPRNDRTPQHGSDASTVGKVDQRQDIREFLSTRRARITPQQAGLTIYGGNRRVPGLRREEVALLAGVSIDYYTRLERGNLQGVSDSVLDALANALQLDDAERAHLFDLARTANDTPRRRRQASPGRIRASVQRVLDAITSAPAWVHNDRLDFLAANALGYALYSEMFTDPSRPVNSARFIFLNDRAQQFYQNWDLVADNTVAILRAAAGRNPYDKALSNLVGELSTRSEDFRVRWASHNVRHHQTGVKRIHHPFVGELELTYEGMELTADPGLTLFTYTAEPASPSEDGLKLLASWAATQQIEGLGLEPTKHVAAPRRTPPIPPDNA
jgi:transcriptional regulator with XRE-family HTH domain